MKKDIVDEQKNSRKEPDHIPMLGAAYYPEDWDEAEQDKDIEWMQKAGMKVIRIAEFAWKCMEPAEGEFRFEWLHRVIDRLKKAGIAVMLGTPSATPPIWLEELDTDMRRWNSSHEQETHGGRRHCCSNNETYNRYSLRIAEKMAQEFGKEEALIGWQIDNEIYLYGDGCFCPTCVRKFHQHLEKKYQTIENLNARWNLNIFSQAYEKFEQVPAPERSWHNPHLLFEWHQFQADSHIAFVERQAEVLRRYTDKPIGTDMMMVMGIDFEKMSKPLDLVQFNHYHTEKNLKDAPFWFDLLRPLKQRPFWNTETAPCWNGSTCIRQSVKPEGFCRVNSWLPIALGGELNMYWLWRQHWAGHELMHGSVMSAAGRPLLVFEEVQQIAAEFEKSMEFIAQTQVETDVALHVSGTNSALQAVQMIVPEPGAGVGDNFTPYLYRVQHYFYQPAVQSGLRPDVIGAGKELDHYRLLISSVMLTLEEENLQSRIADWVRNGGVWVVGPMTDIRNEIGAHYKDRAMGIVEELTGATLTYQVPDEEHMLKAVWTSGEEFTANEWLQLYDVPENAEILAKVSEGYFTAVGKVLAAKIKVGKGCVILVGTFPDRQDMLRLMEIACRESGVKQLTHSSSVTAVRRSSSRRQGYMALEHDGIPAFFVPETNVKDLWTDQEYAAGEKIIMRPYDVRILEEAVSENN